MRTGRSLRTSVCVFAFLLVVFLGLPAGFHTIPALFQGRCSCGDVSVDRNLLGTQTSYSNDDSMVLSIRRPYGWQWIARGRRQEANLEPKRPNTRDGFINEKHITLGRTYRRI